MSLTSDLPALPNPARAPLWRRLGIMLAAVAIIALAMGLIGLWLGPVSKPPPRNPFGMGLREATPSGSLGAWILSVQSGFYGSLQAGVREMKQNGSALYSLLLVGFAYGIFHAAGPGHGKGVISAYLVADEKALRKGFALSLAAALVQALVAIAIVVRREHPAARHRRHHEQARDERGTGELRRRRPARRGHRLAQGGQVFGRHGPCPQSARLRFRTDCDHVHMPPPEELGRLTRFRDMAGVALAAGIRPCAGALIVLVFALSQGVFAAGIAATFAMALGTALTTGAIAALAVFFKAAALRIAGGRGASGAIAIAGLELLAAAFVLVLGASLLYGLWAVG